MSDWRALESFSFGDGPALADDLLALVLAGTKTATCWSVRDGQITALGKRMVVRDGQGRARAVLETVELTRRRFDAVDAGFARDEGEGDLTLADWRAGHERYFTRNDGFAPDMELWCERFRLAELIDLDASPALLTATAGGRFASPAGEVRCALGRSGVVALPDKREGDGATPLGRYRLLQVHFRADRLAAPPSHLPTRALTPQDGWCDDPADAAYNRFVTHPYPASAERLWREDGLYDVVVVLDHNTPSVPGRGSAIFLHCANPGWPPTEGCVAVARDDLLAALAHAWPGDALDIRL